MLLADEHLIGAQHHHRVLFQGGALDDAQRAFLDQRHRLAGADVHRQADDRIALRLAVHFGQHRVGLALGEEPRILDRRTDARASPPP
jgi:hypothetical protein